MDVFPTPLEMAAADEIERLAAELAEANANYARQLECDRIIRTERDALLEEVRRLRVERITGG
jgi:hypothetical protein